MRVRKKQRRTFPNRRALADLRKGERRRARLAPLVQRRSGQDRRTRQRRSGVERRVLPGRWMQVLVAEALPLPREPRSIPWNSILFILFLASGIIGLYLFWKALA